jgi:hypothetical protein
MHMTNAELIAASLQAAVLFTLQYVAYLLIIIPIHWWCRGKGPAAYGLTRAGSSWT